MNLKFRIIDLQRIVNELPEAFTNTKGIMKSHIPAVNAPERIEIPHKVDELEFQVYTDSSYPEEGETK